ncbi:Translation machinery-associated protein 22, partial [Elasticomyces elasticus]
AVEWLSWRPALHIKDAQKKAAKAEAAEVSEKNPRVASKVYIKRVERNKRNNV